MSGKSTSIVWKRGRVIRELQQLSDRGVRRTAINVRNYCNDLGLAARLLFGNLEAAREVADLTRRNDRRRRWKEESVSEELKRLRKAGVYMRRRDLNRNVPGLYDAAVRIFGSLSNATKSGNMPNNR